MLTGFIVSAVFKMKTGQRFSILFLLLAGFFLFAGAQEVSISTSFSTSNSLESSRKLKDKVSIRIRIRQKIKGQNQIKNFLNQNVFTHCLA